MDDKKTIAEQIAAAEAELKPRQRNFIKHLDACGIERDAAIRAGYSEKSASQQASRLLSDPKIREYRRLRALAACQAMGIDEHVLLYRLNDIYLRSVSGVPHMSWDSSAHEYVPDGAWVFDAKNALRALEMMTENAFFRKIIFEGTAPAARSPASGEKNDCVASLLSVINAGLAELSVRGGYNDAAANSVTKACAELSRLMGYNAPEKIDFRPVVFAGEEAIIE